MQQILSFIKKEAMLTVSLLVAVISLFITPPDMKLLYSIDWKTLATLFMLLSVLDGFKHENLFQPVINLAGKIKSQAALSFFLIFSVFFSSMFVTNDVSLIIFVPLTIMLFRAGGKEQYTVPVLVMENIAAVRGSLLTPFGSPQNLFLYSQSGISTLDFIKMMLPLWIMSMVLLSAFIFFLYRKNEREKITVSREIFVPWTREGKRNRIVYFSLFALILVTIISRTQYWLYVTAFVIICLLIFDRKVFKRVDYALILTFLCFFVFSSSISANESLSKVLEGYTQNNEYFSSIVLSQFISNVPASIVLYPYTNSLKALIYGLDSAGLVTIIGSLASVINLRLYTKEYEGQGKRFILQFEIISLIFFVIIFFPQLLLCR